MSADVIVIRPDGEANGDSGGARLVTVAGPFQVVHDGVVYLPGDMPEVPEDVAAQWLAAGWVTE